MSARPQTRDSAEGDSGPAADDALNYITVKTKQNRNHSRIGLIVGKLIIKGLEIYWSRCLY